MSEPRTRRAIERELRDSRAAFEAAEARESFLLWLHAEALEVLSNAAAELFTYDWLLAEARFLALAPAHPAEAPAQEEDDGTLR